MDDDLLRCVQIPIDEKAFERVLTRFDPLIRQVIKNHVWRVDLRDDAYQEAVFLIARKFCTYRTDQPIEPWLCAVARNACVDMGRKEKRQGRDAEPTPDEDFDRFAQKILPDVDASADSDLNDIQEVWMALKQAYPNRAKMLAFQWHYRDGMTLEEVARRLQMPFNTVKGWPASVLEWLHPRMLEELQKRGWEFDAMQRLRPKLRRAVSKLKECQTELRDAELKTRQAPRHVSFKRTGRKVRLLIARERSAARRFEEARWKGKRRMLRQRGDERVAELEKRRAAVEAAEKKVKGLMSRQRSAGRSLEEKGKGSAFSS